MNSNIWTALSPYAPLATKKFIKELSDYEISITRLSKKASDAAVMCFKMKSGRNGLLVLPTGAGKSLIIADIAARLEEPLIVFQPNKEILEQNFAKLQTYGIWDCSIYSMTASGWKD